jgi:uncharacterized protein YkwD
MPSFSPRRHRHALIAGLVLCATAATSALPVAPAFASRHRAASSSVARAAASCADANLVPSSSNLARIATATLCLINQQRTAAHLVALRSNAALNTAASRHSAEMVAKNYFDHVSPTGTTPLSRMTAVGYIKPNTSWSIGENIAAATGSLATPASMVSMWMNSSGHRANILNPSFRDSGIGATAMVPRVVGAGAGGTYTEDFGVTS